MNFLEILRFEIDYRLRRPVTWILFVAFLAITWLMTTGFLVGEAERAGDLLANGPAALGMATLLTSMIGLVIGAALFSEAGIRDHETRIHPLFAASPVTRVEYLAGRFAGTLVVNLLFVSAVPLTLMLLLRPPFVKAELLAPFRLISYIQPAVALLLPNVVSTGAIFFAVAVLTRRSLPVFATGTFLFFGALIAEEVVAEQFGLTWLGALIDPFGFVALNEQWELWTTHEKNTRLLTIDAGLIWNRVLWSAIGSGVLLLSCSRYRMEAVAGRRRRHLVDDSIATPPAQLAPPRVAGSFDRRARMHQLMAIAGDTARELILSHDFAIISLLLAILVVTFGAGSLGDNFGTPFWPLTQFIAPFLGSFLPALTIALLTTFYAGELIHRERDAGLGDIADVVPVPDWVLYLGKFGALAAMLAALQVVMTLSGILLQVSGGYFQPEPGLYLRIVFGLKLVDYLLLAAVAMLVHTVVDNKYIGHVLVVIVHLLTIFAARFGLHHNLLVYGRDSGWTYSDISGFGPFLGPVLWFKLYWAGWALLFGIVAGLLSIRGRDRGWVTRLKLAGQRFGRGVSAAVLIALFIIIGAGSFIFYNTNVLAGYESPFEAAARRAEYERRYSRFESAPQPTVTGTKLHVEIYPERRSVDVRGTYVLANATPAAIRTVHLFLNPEVETRTLTFDRASRVTLADDRLGHRSIELTQPLAPGQQLQMTFEIRFAPRGFPNSDANSSVVGNGTYFDHNGGRRMNHRRWLPLVGYQPSRELTVARVRTGHGLPAERLPRSALDAAGVEDTAGRETITFEAVIGTSSEQIAIAPGTLQRSWTSNGRRYFHYATDGPVKNAFAIFSAKYAVHRETHKGVLIELFHHPTHTFNVARFAKSVRASLDYYTEHFGPYPLRQIRIAEFPRYANLAHAYPGTISYAEATGWLTKVDEKSDFDLPSMVVAHEVAHQWWGFQVMPAAVAGGPAIAEVLAQYSALMVIEKMYGMEMVERFLWNTRIEYLNRRGSSEHPEVPLLDVTNHANLVYRKGPLIMYALRQYIGEAQINAPLRRLVETYGSGQPPFATTRDLLRELKTSTPPEYHYLLHDFLETITLWSLRTTSAAAEPAGNGAWRVTLGIEARKLRADGSGKESEVAMNDFVEIGVYGGSASEPLYLAQHRIRSGRQTISVLVKGAPARAGIDPQLLLIDRNWTDNMRPITPLRSPRE